MEIKTTLLLEKSKQGDKKALNELIQGIYPELYKFCLRYVGNHDEAMEITQKSLIKIYKNFSKLKAIEAWKSWAYKITFNICHEENRKAKKHKLVSIYTQNEANDIKKDLSENPDKQLEQKETKKILSNALQKLPEEQRVVLVMKEYQGLKFREIADTLNISENTAKSRLYYAFKTLKKNLEIQKLNPKKINYAV